MFRERNRRPGFRENLTQTTPVIKKKQLGQKKKMIQEEQQMDLNDDENDQSTIQEEKMMHQARLQAWQRYEQISQRSLHKQDRILRNHLLTVLLFQIQHTFSFKLRTIQHTIKMLDLYESKRDHSKLSKQSKVIFKKDMVYPQNSCLMIDFLTCLFISAKYNEIYPPSLYDLIDCVHPSCRPQVILKNQFSVLQTLSLNMNVALPSDWYKLTNKTMMPVWVYLCYLDYDLKDKSKFIVEEINIFIEKFLGSKDPSVYELFRLHERTKDDKIMQKEDVLKLYQAFVQFRLNRKVGKLTIESQTKDNKQNESKSSRTLTIKSRQNHFSNII